MIVRLFLQWVRTAGAAERAEATAALARAYLYSDLSADDRAASEGALIMLLDDPSPLVRTALARALAFSEDAPLAVILGLGVHVDLSPSARRLHRTVTGSPTRRTRVAACVRPAAGLPGRPEQAAGRDCARLGVQPVGKPVVAVAGDVVEYGLRGCAAGSSLFTSRVE